MRYNAFMSYSHAADGELAPALQSGLERLTRSFYQRNALRIFRDQTNLSTSPGLWSSVQESLTASEFFILLASPRAAESKWVKKEVEFWLKHRSPKTLLIVLTDGNITWNDAGNDFDFNTTNAIPLSLGRVFPEEPFLLDLRWAKGRPDLTRRNSIFLDAVATLAATLHGKSKDELIGYDVAQRKRTKRFAIISALALILIVGFAWQQRTTARSRALAATSLGQIATSPQLGALLAMEAINISPTAEAVQALRETLIRTSVRAEFEELISASRAAGEGGVAGKFNEETASRTGRFKITSADKKGLTVAEGGKEISRFDRHSDYVSSIDFNPDESLIVSVDEDGVINVWETRSGKSIAVLRGKPKTSDHGYDTVAWSPDGKYIVAGRYDNSSEVWATGTWKKIASFNDQNSPVDLLAISAGGRYVVTASPSEFDNARRDPTTYLWDLESGRTLHTIDDDQLVLNGVAFSPGGSLAILDYDGGTTRLWSASTGTTVLVSSSDEFTPGSGLSGDVVSFTAGGYNSENNKKFNVKDVGFTADSKFLLTMNDDDSGEIWELPSFDAAPRKMEETLKARATEAVSPDNRYVVKLEDSSITDRATGTVLGKLPMPDAIVAAAFSPDMKRIAVADGTPTVRIYRWESFMPADELITLMKSRIKQSLTPEDRARFLP